MDFWLGDLIKHHPLATHLQTSFEIFANIFRHICKHLEILKIPSSDGFLARWSATCTTRLMCMPQRWVSFLNKLKIICLEIQNVFLIKLHNIFVKNTKYICSNHKIYLLKLRHIVQSLVSLISPKSRLLSLSCVMGRLCVTKKLFCPTVEFLANLPGGCAWH